MNEQLKETPLTILDLAKCDQEQLNSIAHLIETKPVNLKSNPAGFIFITKEQGNPIGTLNDLANYYQKKTGQILKIGRYL